MLSLRTARLHAWSAPVNSQGAGVPGPSMSESEVDPQGLVEFSEFSARQYPDPVTNPLDGDRAHLLCPGLGVPGETGRLCCQKHLERVDLLRWPDQQRSLDEPAKPECWFAVCAECAR